MKPEKQRIAIAKACGWVWRSRIPGAVKVWDNPPKFVFYDDDLPDYLNDMNAMYEAESRIVDWVAWRVNLSLVVGTGYCPDMDSSESVRAFAHATAPQRAESFLKTLGLWEA
jgi:hypothetical protein